MATLSTLPDSNASRVSGPVEKAIRDKVRLKNKKLRMLAEWDLINV